MNIANTFTDLTSPSCFESFINLYDPNKTNIISIGDSTSSYIKSVGYSPLITSKMQTYEGISNSIISYFKNQKYRANDLVLRKIKKKLLKNLYI